MKHAFIYIVIFLSVSCGKQDDKKGQHLFTQESITLAGIETGELTVTLSAINNRLLHLAFFIDRIYLINSEGALIDISDEGFSEGYHINFASLEGKSRVLLATEVPEGDYQGIALDIDLSRLNAKDFNRENHIETPNFFDAYGIQVTGADSMYRIEANLPEGSPLGITPEKMSSLSITLDSEASIRWLSESENSTNNYLISPVFSVNNTPSHKDNVQVSGIVRDFDKNQLSLSPDESGTLYTLPLTADQAVSYTLDGNPSDFASLKEQWANPDNPVYVNLTGEWLDNAFNITAIRAQSIKAFPYLSEGIVAGSNYISTTRDLRESASREALTFAIQPLAARADQPLLPGTAISALSKQVTLSPTDKVSEKASTVFGIVHAIDENVILVDIAGINHLQAGAIVPESNRITIDPAENVDSSHLDPSQIIELTGHFTAAGFHASSLKVVDTDEVRMTLSMPLDTNKRLFTTINNTGFKINEELSDLLYRETGFSGWPIGVQTANPIDTIKLGDTFNTLMIITERVVPSHKAYRFTSKEEFLQIIMQQRQAGFLINSIVVDGSINDNTFLAKSIIVTFFGQPDEEETTLNGMANDKYKATLLRGPNVYETPYSNIDRNLYQPIAPPRTTSYTKQNRDSFISTEDIYQTIVQDRNGSNASVTEAEAEQVRSQMEAESRSRKGKFKTGIDIPGKFGIRQIASNVVGFLTKPFRNDDIRKVYKKSSPENLPAAGTSGSGSTAAVSAIQASYQPSGFERLQSARYGNLPEYENILSRRETNVYSDINPETTLENINRKANDDYQNVEGRFTRPVENPYDVPPNNKPVIPPRPVFIDNDVYETTQSVIEEQAKKKSPEPAQQNRRPYRTR